MRWAALALVLLLHMCACGHARAPAGGERCAYPMDDCERRAGGSCALCHADAAGTIRADRMPEYEARLEAEARFVEVLRQHRERGRD